jgi:superfamily II DNA or RNA helicase
MNITKSNNQKNNNKIIKDAKSYNGTRGYIIRKKMFTEKELSEVRSDLMVCPNSNSDYGKPEEPYKIYLENENKLYLPKFYGIEKFGKPEQNILPEGKDIDVSFSLSLKEEQKIPAQHTMNAYQEKGGGILSLPCGFGKTILALYFIGQLKKKTIVIVHKEFLMNQWIERIKFALPSAKIGILQGDKCQIKESDIIIAMLQTLSMKEFPSDTFDEIGHVIIDECHRIPSKVFCKALLKINSKYMLGLSATPNRKDGLTKVLKWYIGDIIYSVKSSEKNTVKVERYILESNFEEYNKEVMSFRGQVQIATMVNNITFYYKRTRLIMERVAEEINKHPNRQFLILSDRKQHLEDMFKLAQELKIPSTGYYVGGMKKEKLKESESCRLLLGTYPMANEGLDIPSLNGLVLATPKSDIIQSVGRICRQKHENIDPLIIDIVDDFSIFENQGRKRLKVYEKKNYDVQDIKYNIDTGIILNTRNYRYHLIQKSKGKTKCGIDDETEESLDSIDNDDNNIIIDTEYNNIDPKTNKKILNKKVLDKDKDIKTQDAKKEPNIDQLFKSFSMFK